MGGLAPGIPFTKIEKLIVLVQKNIHFSDFLLNPVESPTSDGNGGLGPLYGLGNPNFMS